jgi:hypothetical protein
MYLESKLNEAHEIAEELVSRLETVSIKANEYDEQVIHIDDAREILHVLDELYARLDVLNDTDNTYDPDYEIEEL